MSPEAPQDRVIEHNFHGLFTSLYTFTQISYVISIIVLSKFHQVITHYAFRLNVPGDS